MRILLLGVAAVALSGCSWFGGAKHHSNTQANDGQGYFTSGGECCKPLSRWNLEGAIGPEFMVGGDALTGDMVHAGTTSTVQSMKDVYDPGYRVELGGSYALNPNRKVTLMGSYAKAKGEEVNLGSFGGQAVTGKMGDYERLGLEAGLRQYMSPTGFPLVRSIRPYAEGKLGVAKVSAIDLENAQRGGAAYNGGTVGLYESSWVPTAAGMVGIEAPIFKRATLGLETGLRYTGSLKSNNTDLNGANPLSGVNNGGSNLTVPVMLRGRYRF